jgi:hypothetical protein
LAMKSHAACPDAKTPRDSGLLYGGQVVMTLDAAELQP